LTEEKEKILEEKEILENPENITTEPLTDNSQTVNSSTP